MTTFTQPIPMTEAPPAQQVPEPVRTMRDLVRRRVEETSLRKVARRVGMSPSGLDKFMKGGAPYPKTVGKLESWYLGEREAEEPEPLDAEALATAVRVLTRIVTPGDRSEFVDELLEALRRKLPPGREMPRGFASYDSYMRFSDS